jgi:tetratricopeptide (TPR) repeat protein
MTPVRASAPPSARSAVSAPLIGRNPEMAALKNAADVARSKGQSRIATLVGAGGLGKSRIISDFLSEVRSAGVANLRAYWGSARSVNQSYGVFARLLRSRFGLVEGMDAEAAKSQVRSRAASALDDRRVGDVCYFLGQLLDLRFDPSPLTKAVLDEPRQGRMVRRAILRSFFESDATQSPLCLIFEDLQDADDDSLDLLPYLIEHLTGPILVVCATRPELLSRHQDWFDYGRSRHERLDLRPLTSDQAAAVMRALLAPCQGGPPEALVEAATRLAAGNPGLLQGMVHVFHDAGVLRETDPTAAHLQWEVDLERLASARLPLTPQDAVETRVGALTAVERRVLEHAAAMGSVFWLGGLVALARMDAEPPEFWDVNNTTDLEQIRSVLAGLLATDHILELPDPAFSGESEYVFKHNLERSKIVTLTSAAAAKRYHQTVADWLAQKEGIRSEEEHCAMLARHLEHAGALTRAGLTYLEAGDIARNSYALEKANEYFSKGLSLLGDGDARRRIDALHNHGDVLLALGKRDEALAVFVEMLGLAYRLGLTSKGGAAHNRIGRLHRDTGSLLDARRHLDTALKLFQAAGDDRGVAACHDDIGRLLWIKGEYELALEELKYGLEMRKRLGDRRCIALSLSNIGRTWADFGKATLAREALEAALELRREIDDPLGMVQTLLDLGQLAQNREAHEEALSLYREAHEMVSQIGERNRTAVVLTHIGSALIGLGESEEAKLVLKEAEGLCDGLGDKMHLAEAKRVLAAVYLRQGELRRARESIRHAVDLFGQVRSKARLAAAVRTLGEITAAGAWGKDHEVKAVDYFMRSIAIFKEIGNELEVARSYRAFSRYVTTAEEYKNNADIQREAQKLSRMADEIFERYRQNVARS